MLALSELAGGKNPVKKGLIFRQSSKKRYSACHSFAHLIKNIAVIGSRSGAGATFFFSIPGKHTESQTYSLLLYTNGSF